MAVTTVNVRTHYLRSMVLLLLNHRYQVSIALLLCSNKKYVFYKTSSVPFKLLQIRCDALFVYCLKEPWKSSLILSSAFCEAGCTGSTSSRYFSSSFFVIVRNRTQKSATGLGLVITNDGERQPNQRIDGPTLKG